VTQLAASSADGRAKASSGPPADPGRPHSCAADGGSAAAPVKPVKAATAAAAASGKPGDNDSETDPALAVRSVLLGFPLASQERDYQQYKAQQLLGQDAWAIVSINASAQHATECVVASPQQAASLPCQLTMCCCCIHPNRQLLAPITAACCCALQSLQMGHMLSWLIPAAMSYFNMIRPMHPDILTSAQQLFVVMALGPAALLPGELLLVITRPCTHGPAAAAAAITPALAASCARRSDGACTHASLAPFTTWGVAQVALVILLAAARAPSTAKRSPAGRCLDVVQALPTCSAPHPSTCATAAGCGRWVAAARPGGACTAAQYTVAPHMQSAQAGRDRNRAAAAHPTSHARLNHCARCSCRGQATLNRRVPRSTGFLGAWWRLGHGRGLDLHSGRWEAADVMACWQHALLICSELRRMCTCCLLSVRSPACLPAPGCWRAHLTAA